MHEEYDYIQQEQKICKEQDVIMIESSFLKGSQRALSNVKGVTIFRIVKKTDRETSLYFKVKKAIHK